MRIFLGVVRISMVQAMGGNPGNWAALTGPNATKGKEILQDFRGLKAAVGQKTVETQGNTKASRNPMENDAKG